jgi:hypothetical protein
VGQAHRPIFNIQEIRKRKSDTKQNGHAALDTRLVIPYNNEAFGTRFQSARRRTEPRLSQINRRNGLTNKSKFCIIIKPWGNTLWASTEAEIKATRMKQELTTN